MSNQRTGGRKSFLKKNQPLTLLTFQKIIKIPFIRLLFCGRTEGREEEFSVG